MLSNIETTAKDHENCNKKQQPWHYTLYLFRLHYHTKVKKTTDLRKRGSSKCSWYESVNRRLMARDESGSCHRSALVSNSFLHNQPEKRKSLQQSCETFEANLLVRIRKSNAFVKVKLTWWGLLWLLMWGTPSDSPFCTPNSELFNCWKTALRWNRVSVWDEGHLSKYV